MKTKFKLSSRILSIVLALVLMVGILPTTSFTASAAETEYDGVIGALYYKVDQENNITTIFGNGALSSTTALVNVMTSNVVIEEGVTSIGNNAFRGLSSLEELTVKGDVTIGNYAFQGCASLETITFMGNVTSVGNNAFRGCDGLSTIYYYGTTEPSYANALSSVTLYSSKGVSFCGLTPIAAEVSYAASVTTAGEGGVTENYSSLTDAITAAQENAGSTLKLLEDVDTNVVIDGGTFTFDLNGHKIEADTEYHNIYLTKSYTLTIETGADITLKGSGSIISNSPLTHTTRYGCIWNKGKLKIDGDIELKTNEYRYNSGIYNHGGQLTVDNCNINAMHYAIECYDGTATINGGSFQSAGTCLYVSGDTSITVKGGSFAGVSLDLSVTASATLKLGVGDDGSGPVFPGGILVYNTVVLSNLLDENCYFKQNGNSVDMTDITTEITGDVSVAHCDHSQNTNTIPTADDASTHSLFCSDCDARVSQENHSLDGGICTDCGYGCSHSSCITENNVTKCAHCPVVFVAQVGDAYFAKLSDAVAAAHGTKGSTLTLLADVKGDFAVNAGSVFALDLNGKTLRGTSHGSIITINTAAELTIKSSVSGGKITGCDNQTVLGTIFVYGTLKLESGKITGNSAEYGGGVVVGGTFVMNGGEITGNTALYYGGGVYVTGEGSFTMNGGSITNNTVTADGIHMQNEESIGGGGVSVAEGTFTMNDGTISGNNASYSKGGGVMVSNYLSQYGSFVMNGGTITGNSAGRYGGGVYLMDAAEDQTAGFFTVNGNSVISGNTVKGVANNVYLEIPLSIGSDLSTTASIGITGSTTPTDAGLEIASSGATERNKSAFMSDNIQYTIVQKEGKLYLYPHIHSWTYTKDGDDKITAVCTATGCTNPDGGYVTISTPSGLTYNGSKIEAVVDNNLSTGADISVTYVGNTTDGYPVNVGDYTASITLGSETIQVQYTIKKATPTADDFNFMAPTDLIYDDSDKAATVTVKDGITGMGEIQVMYFRYASGMWIDNQRVPHYPGKYKVGIWIKEGDNYNAVYSNERIWLGDEFEIKYLTTDAKADISGTMGSNGWYTSDVTLTAPDGYQISESKYSDGFSDTLAISDEQNGTFTYYLRNTDGEIAEKTVELKIDKTAPAAKYKIGTDEWKQFINTITFGLFCKDYKTVDIEYTDDLSGVSAKQYYIASAEVTDLSSMNWSDYTDTLNLNATGKYFIYMRVVDNAGHEVILNTEGVVIYEDSVQVTESVSTTYNAGTDKDVTVKLNGNTVNAIKNGNSVLTADTDYTASADGTITLKASYLDALNAGEYTFTVSYNPQGVETDKVNMTTTFTVKVEKADGKVSNLNISGKTYDGTAVAAPTFDKLGDGAATIEYKVKGADDSTYTITAPSAAGDYVVRVTVAESENYKAASATAEFTIGRASITGISVKQDGKLTYNGKAQTPTVSVSATSVDGSKVTFTYSTESEGPYSTEIPSFTNAGWTNLVYYRATAENHNASYGSFLVEIEKATVTEPTIASKPYSGSAQTADISDTDLYTVEKNNGGTEKGSYDVVLKLKDSANYKWSTTNNAEVTLQFVISAAQNAWDTNPSISGWTYGEAAKTPVGTAKYGAVKVVYTGKANDGTDYNSETAPTKAGNYTATFTVTGTEDYSGLSEQVNFTIAKKAVTVTANDASKTYGESDPALTYTHTELVGSDALVITVARTSGENANTYTITASQAEGANPNYEITFKTGTFTIHKATLTVTVEDKTATYGDPVPTYTVKYEGFKSGDDKDDLGGALAFECGYAQFSDKGEYTIKASGYTSGNYTISYVDGKLTVNAKPITVTIQNATSVYGDTLAELKATDNGIVNGDTNVYSLATTATGTSNVGKYTITGTALDSNYDVTFVNGEYEITKREITITVDAKNTVFNTTLPTYTYKVEGLVGVDTLVTEPTLTCNANIALIGEYDITASGADAGGNYSIKYVPAKLTVLTDNAVDAAAGYTEELKDYDPATVTSEDKAELEEMLSEINTILADETTTDNGKKALEEVKEQVEKLIKEITDAAEATDTENTEKVENVTPENVTPENKTDLEGAKADLEKALEDNGGNYTEDEKKAIEDEIKRIDDALEVIGNVEAVEKVISKLPAVDTVKPDDEEAIKAITDAQTAYNALSDYEKSLVDEATKAALDKLAAALVAYDIVEGDGSSWTENSNPNITFVVNGLFSKFVGIKVDGKDVDKANYEVKAGSTIITLKASYLDTLAVGEHTITVVYTDGSTDGTFNVHAKANSPATGDNSNMFLWIALLFISGGAVITLTVVDRKRRSAANK